MTVKGKKAVRFLLFATRWMPKLMAMYGKKRPCPVGTPGR